jgi:thiamine biosynthesis lipoprotein
VATAVLPAMGTTVSVSGDVDGEVVDGVADLVRQLEARWSRFRPDSELSWLNAHAGEGPQRVSPGTAALVEGAVTAWLLTDGRFDPTVLPALVAAGYDRDFAAVPASGPAAPAVAVPGCAWIRVDPAAGLVDLPAGTALDLGGIAKGHTADVAAEALLRAGATWAVVDVGGDIRLAGAAPGGAWEVHVEDPFDPARLLAVLRLAGGGVATSSRVRRRWQRGGVEQHHLLDPSSGRPADGGLAAVTVVSGSAAWAEVLAKAAFVAGSDGAADVVGAAGATGLLVLDDGEVVELPGLDAFR